MGALSRPANPGSGEPRGCAAIRDANSSAAELASAARRALPPPGCLNPLPACLRPLSAGACSGTRTAASGGRASTQTRRGTLVRAATGVDPGEERPVTSPWVSAGGRSAHHLPPHC